MVRIDTHIEHIQVEFFMEEHKTTLSKRQRGDLMTGFSNGLQTQTGIREDCYSYHSLPKVISEHQHPKVDMVSGT